MSDPKQLPHLLKLLDDDSETVRETVTEALAAFGPDLESELSRLEAPPSEHEIKLIRERLKQREARSGGNPVGPVRTEALFEPGQLVRHRRYGYRGVVVAFDPTCQAEGDWYQANRSQPDRDQPWYHVLVHDSTQVTYAAQNSLLEDDSGEEVAHPFVTHFFSQFQDGFYVRNDRPWPG